MALALLSGAGLACAESSYLRAGDHIGFIGDSITASGYYGSMVHEALRTAYPDAGIKAVSHAAGGQTAAGGIGLLKGYVGNKPTIVCVMFAVNDTGWAANAPDQKAATFAGHLNTFADLRDEHGFELIFLRTSDFSHNASPDGWVDGLNKVVQRLFEEQDRVAAERNVPVVDVHGAYRRALARAWEVDPKYEFTPDVVHPLLPGAAAMAAEILRAFGFGLPLAGAERGKLRTDWDPQRELRIRQHTGIVSGEGAISISARAGDDTLEGAGMVIAASGQAEAESSEDVSLSMAAYTDRYHVSPLLMLFTGKHAGAFGASLLHVSRIADISGSPFGVTGDDFTAWAEHMPGGVEPASPVGELTVSPGETDGIVVRLAWRDPTPVPANPGFKTRFGQQVDTPLNLDGRAGSQPCDAVELLLDLRPGFAAGRYTAGVDAQPEGVMRIGLYMQAEGGKTNVAVQVAPQELADKVSLTHESGDTHVLTLKGPIAGEGLAFNVMVTDKPAFGKEGLVYHLGGVHPQDPLGFIRLGKNGSGLYYRVGY